MTPEQAACPRRRSSSAAHRAIEASWGGERWIAGIEDASRLRDALGVPLPIGVPVAFIEPVADPLGDLVGRYARTHGPFTAAGAALRLGLGVAVVTDTLRRLADERRVTEGEFRPGGTGTEWCDVEVLRRLRRRSLAALRKEVEPVEQAAFARFLPEWQHVGTQPLRGVDGVAAVIEQLAGVPMPASAWESLILPARVRDYSPGMLDELTATGEVVWSGTGRLAGNDGWIALHLADALPVTLPLARGGRPHAARAGGARHARRRRRLLLPAARRHGRRHRRRPADHRALEPRLGRARHQRHVRARPSADRQRAHQRTARSGARPARPLVPRPRAPGAADPVGAAGGGGPLGDPPAARDATRRFARPRRPRCCSTATAS